MYNNSVNIGGDNLGEIKQSIEHIETSINDIDNIIKLISEIRPMLCSLAINDEEKENIVDDIDIIDEEMKKDAPKIARINKAIVGIKSFITSATSGAIASSTLIAKMQIVVEKVGLLVGKIQSLF